MFYVHIFLPRVSLYYSVPKYNLKIALAIIRCVPLASRNRRILGSYGEELTSTANSGCTAMFMFWLEFSWVFRSCVNTTT